MAGPLKFVLGCDIGTGSCKSVLLDASGRVVARSEKEYASAYPQPGWVEQDPGDWYAAFCVTVQQLLSDSRIGPGQIACLAIAGVTHNPVLLDAAGQLLRPAIHFWDRRSVDQVAQIKARWGEAVRRLALNEVDPLWTWPQLLWLKQHEPALWPRIAALLFPKDYVRGRLTGRLAGPPLSDTIDPTGTLFYNPRTARWIEPFVQDLGLPDGALPTVQPPLALAGSVDQRGAEDTGLLSGTPVITGTSDTAAEVAGAGALYSGQAIVKLASVGRIMLVLDRPLDHPRSLNYPHVIDGLWYPGTVTKHGASAYRWARDTFWRASNSMATFRDMDQAAAGVSPGCQGLLFFPHLSGEYAPQWDPQLRAAFLGLTVQHQRSHLTRAVLEGVAFQIRAALEQIVAAGGYYYEIRLIGGGAASPLWGQIMADVLGCALVVPVERSAAYGAGLLAGQATGLFPQQPQELADLIPVAHRLKPDDEGYATYQKLYNSYREIGRELNRSAHRLEAFSGDYQLPNFSSYSEVWKESSYVGGSMKPLAKPAGPVRVAFIGCGNMARYHLSVILKHFLDTQVPVVCEPDPEQFELTAEEFRIAGRPVPPNEPDLATLLAKYGPELDATFIVTPHALHHDQTVACLEAGLDVLLEKPMVMNVAEAKSLIETRDRSGRLLVVAFNGSLSPEIRTAVAMLRSGELGPIQSISATIWQNWRELTGISWRQVPSESGGGFMFDTGAHMLNTTADLAGEPFVEVAAWLDNRGANVDIMGMVMARLQSGALVTMHGSGETVPSCASDIRVFCPRAILRTGAWGGFLEIQRAGPS